MKTQPHFIERVLEATPNLVFVYDMVERRNIFVNQAVEKVLGYTPEQIQAMAPATLASFVHPVDAQRIREEHRRRDREGGDLMEVEYRMRRADGRWCWLRSRDVVFARDAKGAVTQILSVCEDVTESHQIQAALEDSEERFRRLFDQSPVGGALLTLEGRFIEVNAAFAKMLGYSTEELAGKKTFLEVTHPEHRATDREQVSKVIDGKLERYVTDKRYLRKDGAVVWGHVTASLMREPGHRPPYFVVVLENITEQRRQEEERKRLEDQLRHSQRLESVGRLAGGIAHDFNNLLTSIGGNVALALMELRPEDPLRSNLSEITKAADAAANLTRQLLAFSRKQIVAPRVIDLNELISQMSKMLERVIGEDIELRVITEPSLARVRVDPGQIEQALVNLVVNARDAMPGGGELRIETANVRLEADSAPPLPPPGAYVRVKVQDCGCGMSDEVRQHLFEPFFTTKPKDKGTGLGLATVYGSITQAGGTVEVRSEPGEGTTVLIYLPRVDDQAEPLDRPAPPGGLPHGSETVLLVEDDPLVKSLACRLLGRLGYKVLPYLKAAEALLAAKEYAERIDLLMTDVVMPGMNGRQMAEELRAQRPGVRVLFTSGYTEDVIAQHGVLERGLHFIAKPYTLQALAIKLREILDPP
jgi:two-component system, cell cycle sensor histidine kinase and response regulator CckA